MLGKVKKNATTVILSITNSINRSLKLSSFKFSTIPHY